MRRLRNIWGTPRALAARIAAKSPMRRSLAEVARVVQDAQSQGTRDRRRLERRLTTVERRLGRRLGSLEQSLAAARAEVAALQRAALRDLPDVPYPERLLLERFRVMSQNEEDGILFALLRAAGHSTRRCVEIGCGDNGGNSGFLVDELGFQGLMIDGEQSNVDAVRRLFSPARLLAERAWVTRENAGDLLREHGFDGEIDVLSIDVDGNDLWIWEALDAVEPRVVAIEYNSLFGPERSLAVPYDPGFERRSADEGGTYWGASLAALAAVGARKGYRLVGGDHRGVNAFFVRAGLAPEIPACAPADAWRLLDKYHRRIAGGFDFYATLDARGLPLVSVT